MTPHQHRPHRGHTRPAGAAPADPVLVPLTVEGAAELVRLAEHAAAERGLRMRYDGDGALLTGDGRTAGLTNLARSVADEPRARWQRLVGEHFDRVFGSMRDGGPPEVPDDLDRHLYLRLIASETVPPDWRHGVPEFVPGVLAAPATYADRAVAMYLDTERLGVDRDTAVETGLRNLRRMTDDVALVGEGRSKVAALTGSMFTASRALVLDTVLRETLRVENPPYGTLVAFPVRDLLLVHVVRDRGMAAAMSTMLALSVRAHGRQPGPISPHVYFVGAVSGDDPSPDGDSPGRDGDAAGWRGARWQGSAWQQVSDCAGAAFRPRVEGPFLETIRRLDAATP